MNLAGGTLLNNRYRIERLLGQGGFGAVYQAQDTLKNQPCAVKVNLDPSPEAARQFEREARTLARLQHKNLPEVIDHFTRPGQSQFLVMQFIEGEDLESRVNRQGALNEADVLPWLEQIAAALDYLHSQQPPIIHRDVKPANIRITNDNQAVLVDFGLVKVYDPQSRTTLGARAVTPGYSPPEQYGQGLTDARSDIYALGATAYTLLTGRESPESTQRAIHDSLRPAHEVNPQLSQHVSQAIARAMTINPAGRFESAGAFYAALATPPPIISPLIPPPQRDQPKIGHTHFEKATPAPPAAPAPAGPPAKAPPGSEERIKWIAYGVLVLIMVGLPLLMSLFLLQNPITPPAGIGQTAAAEQATSGSQATAAAQVNQTTTANETATGRAQQTTVALLTQIPPSATPTNPPSVTSTSPPPTPAPASPPASTIPPPATTRLTGPSATAIRPASVPTVPPTAKPRSIAGMKSLFCNNEASGRSSSGVPCLARMWMWRSSIRASSSSSTMVFAISTVGTRK